MNRHTPGPWHVGQMNGAGSVFADHGRTRYEDGTVLYPICKVNRGWDEAEDEANSLLIASAPDLLAACLKLIEGANKNNAPLKREILDAIVLARAAIAKATGE